MGAHMAHGVVMDVTAFKVCHSVEIDATALQAAIEMCSSTRGDGGRLEEGIEDRARMKAREDGEHTTPASLS